MLISREGQFCKRIIKELYYLIWYSGPLSFQTTGQHPHILWDIVPRKWVIIVHERLIKGGYLRIIDELCLSFFRLKYTSFLINVKNKRANSITNRISVPTKSINPKLPTSCHQLLGHIFTMLCTMGTHIAYKIGKSQLRPMAPRSPEEKFTDWTRRSCCPTSYWTMRIMAIRVVDPMSKRPASVELITLDHSWKMEMRIQSR